MNLLPERAIFPVDSARPAGYNIEHSTPGDGAALSAEQISRMQHRSYKLPLGWGDNTCQKRAGHLSLFQEQPRHGAAEGRGRAG